jgi:hypothetical protein
MASVKLQCFEARDICLRSLPTLCSSLLLPLGEVFGAAVAGKHGDVVPIWVDEGPTLAFHTTPASAQALQADVDGAHTVSDKREVRSAARPSRLNAWLRSRA